MTPVQQLRQFQQAEKAGTRIHYRNTDSAKAEDVTKM
jgi:hypothetical protein